MGDGLVLEQGTHNQLLTADGAYARLVATQKLREADNNSKDSDSTAAASEEEVDMEKAAREEIPLGRKNTGRSLASEILEQRKNNTEAKETGDHSLPYLFKRMAMLNRQGWSSYIIGSIFATSKPLYVHRFRHGILTIMIVTGMVYPAFGVVYAKGIEGFSYTDPKERRFAGDRNALW